MADNKTQIIITAKDETRAAIASAQSSLNSLHATASRFQFGGLTAGLAVFSSGVAFAGAIKGAISFAASLDDMSEATGASVENLSALSSVAKVGSHDLDTVAASLQKLGRALHSPDDETKGAARALSAIGLSVDELKQKDPAEAMLEIAQSLDKFKDGSGKAAVAMAIFGKAGAQLLPFLKDLAEQQTLTGKITAEQAALAEQYEKNMNRLSGEFGKASKVIAMDLLPTLARMSEEMYDGVRAAGGFFAALSAGATINPFKTTSENLKTVRADLEEMERVSREEGYTDEKAMARKRAQLEMLKAQQRREALAGDPDKNKDANDRKFERKFSLNDFVTNEEKEKKGKKQKEMSAEDRAYGGYEGAYKDFTEAIKRVTDNAENAAAAEVQIEEEKQRRMRDLLGNTTSYRIAEYEKQKQALRDALQIGEIDTSQFEEAMAKIDESITKLTEDGKDKFKDLERAIDGWGKNSAKALADFVTEGKASFGDLARSIINDLLQMAIYQNITGPLFKSLGGEGGFLSDIGSALGFGGGRATGGPVVPGQYYVVGENGPEVLVPGMSGTVIPNGGGGGMGLVVNIIEAPGKGGETQQRQENGQNVLDIFVEKVKGAIAGDIARGDGAVPAALGATYGLNRVAGAY